MGAFVTFDLMRRSSFTHLQNWVNKVKEHALHDCQIVIVGNKSDICAGLGSDGSGSGSGSDTNSIGFIVG